MSGQTPKGYPFAVGSDALTDWPPISEQLAEMLDQATLLGLPVFKSHSTAAQVIPTGQNVGLQTLTATDFAQGGLTNYGPGGGVLLGQSGLYFAMAQVGWDTYPNGFRQLLLQNWGGAQLGVASMVPNAGGYTMQQVSGVMSLSAGDVIVPVVAQQSGQGVTIHAAYTWLFAVRLAVLDTLAELLPAPGPFPPEPRVEGEMNP